MTATLTPGTGKLNIRWNQGQTFDPILTLRDTVSTVPLDLTGQTARLEVRKTAADSAVLVQMTTTNGKITIPTPLTGQLYFLVPEAEVKLWTPGKYVYDLELRNAAGRVWRVLEGSFEVIAEVTRVDTP